MQSVQEGVGRQGCKVCRRGEEQGLQSVQEGVRSQGCKVCRRGEEPGLQTVQEGVWEPGCRVCRRGCGSQGAECAGGGVEARTRHADGGSGEYPQ